VYLSQELIRCETHQKPLSNTHISTHVWMWHGSFHMQILEIIDPSLTHHLNEFSSKLSNAPDQAACSLKRTNSNLKCFFTSTNAHVSQIYICSINGCFIILLFCCLQVSTKNFFNRTHQFTPFNRKAQPFVFKIGMTSFPQHVSCVVSNSS